jgi:hypothetical protein
LRSLSYFLRSLSYFLRSPSYFLRSLSYFLQSSLITHHLVPLILSVCPCLSVFVRG